ncbi:MAG: response regulator [Promethearchaeota archaeon]
MITEDSLTIQILYAKMLESIGFKIIGTASNGQEAIELFNKFPQKPDFIIMDHRMPIKNGIEVMEEIRKSDNIPKIIITSADTTIKQEAIRLGAFKFLDKTFRLGTLKQLYNEFLENWIKLEIIKSDSQQEMIEI